MRDGKITLSRAVNCRTPYRHKPNEQRYAESKAFHDKYGFYYEDVWNLDMEFAYFMLVRLVELRRVTHSMPASFCTGKDRWGYPTSAKGDFKRWKEVLDKMIRGFYLYCTVDFPDKKQTKIIDKAMKLFAENWQSLWD